MLKGTQAHGAKHKDGIQEYPSPRRLGQHHQSMKTWQKARKHVRKAIEHAMKQDKEKNMLGKAMKYIIKQDKEKVVDCS